jgi:hypothetical protein
VSEIEVHSSQVSKVQLWFKLGSRVGDLLRHQWVAANIHYINNLWEEESPPPFESSVVGSSALKKQSPSLRCSGEGPMRVRLKKVS